MFLLAGSANRYFWMHPVETIPVGNALGECVLWDESGQTVWWTDIDGRTLYRLDWQNHGLQTFATPARLASFGFVKDRREIVAAFEQGVALFDPWTATVTGLVEPEGLKPGMRLNDGRVDPKGRFWVGSMVENRPGPAQARLYCLEGGRLKTREQGLSISNSLCWSPDGRWCYFADSPNQIVWRYRYDPETCLLTERQEFAHTPGTAMPDGATVDAEGYVWCALWGGGAVARFAPDGRTDRILDMPVSQPSCVSFGGPGLDHLFVTSARCGLDEPQTGAGDLFVYNMRVQGLPENRFDLEGWPDVRDLLRVPIWRGQKDRT